MFTEVSQERRSVVWQHFLLDKSKGVAKCKVCAAKNVTKILKCSGGNTKSLIEHMERIHKEKEKSKPNSRATINHYYDRKSLGETVAKLAISGIPFRTISDCEVLREAFSVSSPLTSSLNTLVDIYLGTASFVEHTFPIWRIFLKEFRNK